MTASAFEAWTLAAGIEAEVIAAETSTGHNVHFANRPLNAIEREAGTRFADIEAIVDLNTTHGTEYIAELYGAAVAAMVIALYGEEDGHAEDAVEVAAAIALLLALYSQPSTRYTDAVEKVRTPMQALVLDSYTGGVLTVLDEAAHQGVNTDRWVPPRAPAIIEGMADEVAAHPMRRATEAALKELQTPRRAMQERISRGDLLGIVGGMSQAGTTDLLHQANQAALGRGRLDMADNYPGVYLRAWASEVMDRATCGPCRTIDGQRFDTLADAAAAYGTGGYINCQGGSRCRGVAVFLYTPPAA